MHAILFTIVGGDFLWIFRAWNFAEKVFENYKFKIKIKIHTDSIIFNSFRERINELEYTSPTSIIGIDYTRTD